MKALTIPLIQRSLLAITLVISNSAFAQSSDGTAGYDSFIDNPAVEVTNPIPGVLVETMKPMAVPTGALNTNPSLAPATPAAPVAEQKAPEEKPGWQGNAVTVPNKPVQNPKPESNDNLDNDGGYASKINQCADFAREAGNFCADAEETARAEKARIDRTSSQLSSNTGVACGQLGNSMASAAKQIGGWGDSCKSKIQSCQQACSFVSNMDRGDINYSKATKALNLCRVASNSQSSLSSWMNQAMSAANGFNSCFNQTGGQQADTIKALEQQRQAENANNCLLNPSSPECLCKSNPRGCGLTQSKEPFAPQNLQPAGNQDNDELAKAEKVSPVGAPPPLSNRFEPNFGPNDKQRSHAGNDQPPRGRAQPPVANEFKGGPVDPGKKKNAGYSTGEKITAEVFRGYFAPQGDTNPVRVRAAADAVGSSFANRPRVGSQILPPSGGPLAKFEGRAQELRQIWAAKLHGGLMQRNLAGNSEASLIPTGVDGLTGPHSENFKKIRGRFHYLERTFSP